jgi:chromate reductase
MSNDNIRLLGIAGSLRQGSFNRALLRAVKEVLPTHAELDIYEGLKDIPPYDGDVEAAGAPPSVIALKEAIAAADGLVIATPEYNYSIPGVLKNAIDWASRPPAQTPLRDKPAGIIGASQGPSGTMRAQYHLRQVFVFMNVHAMGQPEVFVGSAKSKFEADGRLHDTATREHLAKWAEAYVAWVLKMRVAK